MKAQSVVINASLLRLALNEGQTGAASLLTRNLQESVNMHLSKNHLGVSANVRPRYSRHTPELKINNL